MADNFLNKTGLTYYHNRIKNVFAEKTALEELDAKVDEIISEGGEPNVIETVKVNGTALPVANKAVDVTVPTATSDLTNDGDGESNFATEAYVDEYGGKIDSIFLNGSSETIENKEVHLWVPSVTVYCEETQGSLNAAEVYEDYNNDFTLNVDKENKSVSINMAWFPSAEGIPIYIDATIPTYDAIADFRTEQQIQALIDASIEGITGLDFQVVQELPATGQKGIIYLLANSGSAPNIYDEYIWVTPATGDGYFEKIGTTDIDLSDYWAKTELQAMTTAEIDAIIGA